MGKPKKSGSNGPRKTHGPKRKLFKNYKPMIHVFAKSGLLSKYSNYESWVIACNARGKRSASPEEFKAFTYLSREEQKAYFENINHKQK